jgi:hypothetical protein
LLAVAQDTVDFLVVVVVLEVIAHLLEQAVEIPLPNQHY